MKQGALLLLLLVSPVAVPAATPGVRFVDVAPEAGLELRNLSGTGPEKWTILESTGAGACFLDREGDGDLDLYLVNGGSLTARGPANPARDALYDNNGEGRFTDVTARTGIAEHAWGGGCAVGDYDNDGDPDLYVTNFGPDALYRNDHGVFHDVTAAAGVGDPRWGSAPCSSTPIATATSTSTSPTISPSIRPTRRYWRSAAAGRAGR